MPNARSAKRCPIQRRRPTLPVLCAEAPTSPQPPHQLPDGEPPAEANSQVKRPPSGPGGLVPWTMDEAVGEAQAVPTSPV